MNSQGQLFGPLTNTDNTNPSMSDRLHYLRRRAQIFNRVAAPAPHALKGNRVQVGACTTAALVT